MGWGSRMGVCPTVPIPVTRWPRRYRQALRGAWRQHGLPPPYVAADVPLYRSRNAARQVASAFAAEELSWFRVLADAVAPPDVVGLVLDAGPLALEAAWRLAGWPGVMDLLREYHAKRINTVTIKVIGTP